MGLSSIAYAASYMDSIYYGFDGVDRAREWVSPDGRMNQQNLLQNSTAIDYWPTAASLPDVDSLSEITLHRTLWSDPNMERFNISAMVDQTDGGAYRFGVERSGGGKFRPILFCFENTSPGLATCPLKITPDGVFIGKRGTWRAL